jgi:hypothetical protein
MAVNTGVLQINTAPNKSNILNRLSYILNQKQAIKINAVI